MSTELDAASEAALIARAQTGDLQAFEPLVDRWLPQIRAFIALRAPAAHLIDELAHETFVFAFRNFRDFAPGTSLSCWLRTIAWNLLWAEIHGAHSGQNALAACWRERSVHRCRRE